MADSKSFHVALITPEAPLFEADILQAQFPAHDGSIGILTHRAPLLTKLGTGFLQLDLPDDTSRRYFISGGYAQMKDNVLTILPDQALALDEITPEFIEAQSAKLHALPPTEIDRRRAMQAFVSALRQSRQ